MKVVHVGAYPPPYGGVSMHIKRLDWFCRQNGIQSIVIDTHGSIGKPIMPGTELIPLSGNKTIKLVNLVQYLAHCNADIVHFHISGLQNFCFVAPVLLLGARHSKRIVTLHSGSFIRACELLPKLMQLYIRFIFQQFDHLIAVNIEQRNYLTEKMQVRPERVSVIPAFLPPIASQSNRAHLPVPLIAFFDTYKDVLVTTGYCKPHYGFHVIIQALDLLQDPSVGLVIQFYTAKDEDYWQQIHRMAVRRENVYLSTEEMDEHNMGALLSAARVFIRGTSLDGDSVALREAAYFGCQIIATDCIDRPKGCLLYTFNDPYQLAERVREALSDKSIGVVECPGLGNGDEIKKVYTTVLK
jgi:glycogen(starch) synthase